MTDLVLTADTADHLGVADAIAARWRELGITGGLHARNVDTGAELGIDIDRAFVLASVAKVPIALAVLARCADGQLDPGHPVALDPATSARGVAGASIFGYPSTIAVADLVALMLTVSDNAAADRLLELVSPEDVQAELNGWGHPDIHIRHRMEAMYNEAKAAGGGDAELALEIAIASGPGEGSVIQTLDPHHANIATARALTRLLCAVWADEVADPVSTAELRRLMRMQLHTQRLSSDLRSDDVRVAGKTGTFLHLRHEIGVVESSAGDRVAISVLTASNHRASIAPDVDLAIGAAARDAFEALRE